MRNHASNILSNIFDLIWKKTPLAIIIISLQQNNWQHSGTHIIPKYVSVHYNDEEVPLLWKVERSCYQFLIQRLIDPCNNTNIVRLSVSCVHINNHLTTSLWIVELHWRTNLFALTDESCINHARRCKLIPHYVLLVLTTPLFLDDLDKLRHSGCQLCDIVEKFLQQMYGKESRTSTTKHSSVCND